MTPAQRNLLDAAKYMLSVFTDPSDLAYLLRSNIATSRLNDAIKAAEADDSDGWTPCGPDGPFPPVGEQVLVTILMPKEGRRFVGVDWMKSPTEWSWWPGESREVVAWKPRAKPYDPKGQA